MTQLGNLPDKFLTAVDLASSVLAHKAQPGKHIYCVKILQQGLCSLKLP